MRSCEMENVCAQEFEVAHSLDQKVNNMSTAHSETKKDYISCNSSCCSLRRTLFKT